MTSLNNSVTGERDSTEEQTNAISTHSSSNEILTASQRPKKIQYCFEYLEGYQPKDLFAEVKGLISSIPLQKAVVDAMILQTMALLSLSYNLTDSLYLPMTQRERFVKLWELVESIRTDDAEEKTLNLMINLVGFDGFCSVLRNKLLKDVGHIAKIVQK